jgi:hypothetical protein
MEMEKGQWLPNNPRLFSLWLYVSVALAIYYLRWLSHKFTIDYCSVCLMAYLRRRITMDFHLLASQLPVIIIVYERT